MTGRTVLGVFALLCSMSGCSAAPVSPQSRLVVQEQTRQQQQPAASVSLSQLTSKPIKPTDPVFHGIKLGVALASQMSECPFRMVSTPNASHGVEKVYDHAVSRETCFEPLGAASGETGGLFDVRLASEFLKSDDPLVVTLPDDKHDLVLVDEPNPNETVENITLRYSMDEANSVLTALKEKYGSPKCESSKKQTGIGITLDATSCRWGTSWGDVSFDAPAEKIDMLSVVAETEKYIAHEVQKSKEDVSKKLHDF